MSADFDSLREDFARTFEAIGRQGDAVARFCDAATDENGRQWQAIAGLRDDLHALANRVESLTRAVTADPGDVADAVMAWKPRHARHYCQTCRAVTCFTEGKCDNCSRTLPEPQVGETLDAYVRRLRDDAA